MKFSTYSSIFLLICLQISIIPQAESQFSYDFRFIDSFCTNSSTFALSSTYNSSINAVLDSFTSNATANSIGYYSNSFGNTSENTVHGYFLCRGDLDNDDCHTCVSTVVRERRTTPGAKCPASKRETIYYTKCMLRYSNTILYGKLVTDVVKVQENPDKLAENQGEFRKLVVDIFRGMVSKAANNQTGKKYAATAGTFPGSITLYATLQCTPDLSAVDCNSCLMFAITSLKARTYGENFMTPSCNIRYEIYPFFNGAADLLLSAPPEANTTSPRKSKTSTGAIIGIAVATTTTVAVFIAIGVRLVKKKKGVKQNDNVYNIHGEDLTVESLQYELSSLQSSTNNFSNDNKLGEGGFGIVYKGTLWNGQDIAVKRLTRSANQGEQEFKNEMLLVAKLQHRNLVRVLGFCLTETEKLLIYEYVPNNSLDKFLFDSENRKQLDWKRRYNIIVGIARGMLYLHEDSRLKIIHRDLKASNVLLDEDMNPKVSDFGTAKIFEVDQTRGSTNRVVGTYGYMAPEYVMNGTFSVKSDVYSFGILVLEIISGRRAYGFFEEDGEPDLINYAWKHRRDNTPMEFIDPCIREQSPVDEVIRCMNIGLLSVQDANQRPSMSTIVLMLSSSSTTTPVPTKPTQFVLTSAKKDVKSDHSTKDSTLEYTNSGDDISLTLPR